MKILLSSHAHYDHAGGLSELKRLTGAKLYAGAGDVAQLARGGYDDPQFANKYPSRRSSRTGRCATASESRSAGSLLSRTQRPVIRAAARHSRSARPATTSSFSAARACRRGTVSSGTPLILRRHFAVLKSLPCDVFLGAHGSFFGLKEKMRSHEFVDPEGYRKFVGKMEAGFEAKVK